jgi:hypothetical protein
MTNAVNYGVATGDFLATAEIVCYMHPLCVPNRLLPSDDTGSVGTNSGKDRICRQHVLDHSAERAIHPINRRLPPPPNNLSEYESNIS